MRRFFETVGVLLLVLLLIPFVLLSDVLSLVDQRR